MRNLSISACRQKAHTPRQPRAAISQQRGFSLLEVLISVIILSFGVLGMVGLQATALQANRDARLQSTASSLARELAEMMRGNRVVTSQSSNPYLNDFTAPLTPVTASYCLNASATTACADATAVANAQMTEWLARVKAELPGAHVKVCVDAAPIASSGYPTWDCATGTNPTTFIKIGWTRGSTDRSSGSTPLDAATRPSIVFPVAPGIQ